MVLMCKYLAIRCYNLVHFAHQEVHMANAVSLSRTGILTDLRERALRANVSDDQGFRDLLKSCQRVLEILDQDLADAFLVSRPTVNRWINGKNLPHRAMRKPIFDWIADQAGRRIRALQEYESQALQFVQEGAMSAVRLRRAAYRKNRSALKK